MNAPRSRTVRVLSVFAAGAASIFLLAGCMPFVASGPMTSEDRQISAVTAVHLQTSGNLSVSEGEPSLTVRAPRDALDHLTSDVDGDTLVLGVTPGTTLGLGQLQYELTLPDLRMITLDGSGDATATVSNDGAVHIDVNGSGDVTWTGLAVDRVEIAIAGSGDVTLAGSAEELAVEVDGSGNVHGVDLGAQHAEVVVRGSGDVDVSPVVSLSVDIFGSGNVTYSGEPELDVDTAGSGDVARR